MAIPSGSGTEVLKASYMHNMSDHTTAYTLIAGDANKIRTVLSVIFNDTSGDGDPIQMWVDAGYADVDSASNQDIYLINRANVPSLGTYVWSDRFVLYGLDALKVQVYTAGNMDVHCSYIEQDWS